jgi:hypothetical protein
MSLESIATELYRLPPAEFTAARNARAAAGDHDEAAAIRRLRRAAPAAWVVNLLAAERSEAIDELVATGEEARAAQNALDRAAITRLGKRRRELVAALSREGAALADAAGAPAGRAVLAAVEATLDAAAADPEAADAVRTGRLVRPLETIGFEPVDLAGAVAVPAAGGRAAEPAPARTRPRAVDELERARREAGEALATAREDADEAEDAARALAERSEALDHRRSELETALAELEERITESRRDLAGVEREARGVDRERDRADRALERARERRTAAERRARDLEG